MLARTQQKARMFRLFAVSRIGKDQIRIPRSAIRILSYRLELLQHRPSLRTNRRGFVVKIFSPSGSAA